MQVKQCCGSMIANSCWIRWISLKVVSTYLLRGSLPTLGKLWGGCSLAYFSLCTKKHINLHSLKLTANAPENRPSKKETIVFQPPIFRCENVSLREGSYPPVLSVDLLLNKGTPTQRTWFFLLRRFSWQTRSWVEVIFQPSNPGPPPLGPWQLWLRLDPLSCDVWRHFTGNVDRAGSEFILKDDVQLFYIHI